MTEHFANREMMAAGTQIPPIIEDRSRPSMQDDVVEGRMPEPSALDPEAALSGPVTTSEHDGNHMAPFSGDEYVEDAYNDTYPDQEPPSEGVALQGSVAPAAGYLRLRLHVVGTELEVLDAWSVEGPLAVADQLHGELAYEVRCGDRQLCVGSVPDAGEIRGFPNFDGPAEQQGHSIIEVPDPEISVRVPIDHLSQADLPNVEVKLFRLKGGAPTRTLTEAPLAMQAEREAREVASLRGLDIDGLPEGRASDLRQAMRP